MLNPISLNSARALPNASLLMRQASSEKYDERNSSISMWETKTPTHQVLTQIEKRGFSHENAGWITINELRQKTGLSQADVISSLRQLFQNSIIETIAGNGLANHRYRSIHMASAADFAIEPEQTVLESLKAAVATEIRIPSEKVETFLLSEAAKNSRKLKARKPVGTYTPGKEEKNISQNAVAMDRGPDKSTAKIIRPEKLTKIKNPIQLRDAKGHFLPKTASPKLCVLENAGLAKKVHEIKRTLNGSAVRGKSVEKPSEKITYKSNKKTLVGENKIQKSCASNGLMVLSLERRPGGPSVSISFKDAIILGQRAVEEMMKRRSTH